MATKPPHGLFITGTSTEVGKTYVAALIARALVARGARLGVYKPAASGCRSIGGELVSDDAVALWEAAGRPLTLEDVCPQRFAAPLAPHLAARTEGRRVDGNLLRKGIERWTGHCEMILVEGAGGLLSPISDEDYVADIALDLGYPLIVVAPNVLGTINQTLQTLVTAASFRDGLSVAGVVLNDIQPAVDDPSMASNRTELEQRCMAPVLAHVPYQATAITEQVDWLEKGKRQN